MPENLIIMLLEVVIMFCIVAITKYVVPWLKSKEYYESLSTAIMLAENFVIYAEQIITGEKKGKERFEYVTTLLTPIINKFGLGLTEDQIASVIENAYQNTIGQE